MIDLDKIVFVNLQGEKKQIKKFNSLNLIEKLDFIKKTNLTSQDEGIINSLLNSFKSKIIKEKGIGQISINYFIIDIEGFRIYIPFYSSNYAISMGYLIDDIRKEEIKESKSKFEELLNLEKQMNELLFFQFKKRNVLKSKIKTTKSELEYIKNRNIRAFERNEKRDKNIKKNQKILFELKEDIKFFKENGYKLNYCIDSIIKENY